MTSYHGGKQRIGKSIADVITDLTYEYESLTGRKLTKYCEPFCGMMSVYKEVVKDFKEDGRKMTYLAGDRNKSVVKMWKKASKGWLPPTKNVSAAKFLKMARDGKSTAKKGFIGHHYGYMGKYFKPYKKRSFKQTKLASEKIREIAKLFKTVRFYEGPYTQFSGLKNSIIYCDPPYQIQNQYYGEIGEKWKFDHIKFWQWCKRMSKDNLIFVSEYGAPKQCKRVWSKGKEKLFVCL